MTAPRVTARRLARIERPAGRNSAPASIDVELCELAPDGAPPHVRPRFVRIAVRRSHGEVAITIRRGEIEALIGALQLAAGALAPGTPTSAPAVAQEAAR